MNLLPKKRILLKIIIASSTFTAQTNGEKKATLKNTNHIQFLQAVSYTRNRFKLKHALFKGLYRSILGKTVPSVLIYARSHLDQKRMNRIGICEVSKYIAIIITIN